MKLSSLAGTILCLFALCFVANRQTGLQRTSTSDASGQYRLTGLPPASYQLTAQLPGFATGVRKEVAVELGQTTIMDFQLKVSSVAVQIEVSDVPSLLETDQGSQTNSISQQYISRLPIPRRDYLTFTQLTPGVSNSNVTAN